MSAAAAITSLALLALLAPAGLAQAPASVYSFEMTPLGPTTVGLVPGQTAATFELEFVDASRDSSGAIVNNPAAPNAAVFPHQIFFDFEFGNPETAGWAVRTPALLNSMGGERHRVEFVATASILIQTPVMPITLIAKTNQGGERFEERVNVTVFSLGVQSFNAQPQDLGGEIAPGTIVDVPIRITNGALLPRGFDIEVTENPCGMLAATSNNNLVGPKETKTYTVSIRTPSDRPWYFSEICTLGIQVAPTDTPSATRSLTVAVSVNGGYMNPMWVFWSVFWIFLVVIAFLFLKRRKERVEEELLGKPQKPWTIPVEALYLRVLRQKDERAWYVVRHHLMEEEYRSSLLWYHAYKKATKGNRKKEALVLRQEKKYERWKAKWEKAIQKPLKNAGRFEAKLQRKLDRKGRGEDRKMARNIRKITKKMAAAHAKQVEKALEKWQKQSRKATKKGIEAPPRPVLPEPDYPEEPEPRSYVLAEHKWAKKAARFRARRVREQGNLEVKFEKADARHLAKLRRKVQRLARKLDDPDFIAEHPLLRSEA